MKRQLIFLSVDATTGKVLDSKIVDVEVAPPEGCTRMTIPQAVLDHALDGMMKGAMAAASKRHGRKMEVKDGEENQAKSSDEQLENMRNDAELQARHFIAAIAMMNMSDDKGFANAADECLKCLLIAMHSYFLYAICHEIRAGLISPEILLPIKGTSK